MFMVPSTKKRFQDPPMDSHEEEKEEVLEPMNQEQGDGQSVKLYKRRWVMLIIFSLCSMANAAHWLQYSIIADIVAKYYNTTTLVVNWTSMVFMAVYAPLVAPAMWVLERKGLRISVILGTGMLVVGSWLKFLSVERSGFPFAFTAQTIIGSAQIFTLGVPARLAGLWFGEDEVSTACAVGVFGNQVGIALSFLLPPAVVENTDNLADMRQELENLYFLLAIPPTLLLLIVIFFFEDRPKKPPSRAQAEAIKVGQPGFLNQLKSIIRNRDFTLLTCSYGFNVGVFYAYSTLLNQAFLEHFPEGHEDAGRVGLTLILGGMLGALFWGYVLDKTHAFKPTTLFVYSVGLIFMLSFSFALYYESLVLVYVTSGLLGFFMNGYLPIAYEYAAVLTYPVPESTSSSFLNAIGEVIGVALVLVAGAIVDIYKDLAMNLTLCFVLGLGLFLCVPIRREAECRVPTHSKTEAARDVKALT